MTIYEQLNIEMDKKAKAFWRLIEKERVIHCPTIFSPHNRKIMLGNLHVSYNIEQSLRDHVQGTELINHLIRTNKLSRDAVRHIDWDAIKGGAKLLPAGDKLWMSKFVSGFCATASQMTLRDREKKSESQLQYDMDYLKWKNNAWPLCKEDRENTEHVLQCPHKRARRNRHRQLKESGLTFNTLILL